MSRAMIRRAMLTLALALAAGAALAQPPPTPKTPAFPPDVRYDHCLARAASEPPQAFEDALGWAAQGGGEPARHCAAVALLHNGQPEAAAVRLEQLAQDMRAQPPALRAEVLAQAGRAWLEGRNAARAAAAFTTALELAPDAADILVDRAEAYAAAANYWEAIDDLNRAIELDRNRAEAYAFRAAAYRLVNAVDLALEDANRAVTLDPRLPEAWLERGILHLQRGDAAAARRDFREVLLLEPEGAAADAARANIERMEVNPDRAPTPPARTRR